MPYKKIAGSSMYTTHAYIYLYIYVHAHIYIYIYMHTYSWKSLKHPITLYAFGVCVCAICLSIYLSIYLYIHTYIQYIHIHSCTDSWPRKHHPTRPWSTQLLSNLHCLPIGSPQQSWHRPSRPELPRPVVGFNPLKNINLCKIVITNKKKNGFYIGNRQSLNRIGGSQ